MATILMDLAAFPTIGHLIMGTFVRIQLKRCFCLHPCYMQGIVAPCFSAFVAEYQVNNL